MNILLFHNQCGSKLYRVYYPAKYLRKYTDHNVIIKDPGKGYTYDDLLWADIISFEMASDTRAIEAIAWRRKQDKPVAIIFEIDDIMHEISANNPAARSWNPDNAKSFEEMMRISDAVSTTTEFIGQYYSKINPNYTVLPNSLDMDVWGKNPVRHGGKYLRLGWAGGISHRDDLMMVKDIIKRILKKYRNVKFVHVGYGGSSATDPMDNYVYGTDLFEDFPPEQRELGCSTLPENWPVRLGTLGFDIGIAPITDEPWNHAKSNLKYLEYGAYKIPSVCSGGKGLTKLPYSYTIESGVDGFLAPNLDEWERYLKLLIENKELRERMGAKAYDKVKADYNMENNWVLWRDFYEKVYKKVSS